MLCSLFPLSWGFLRHFIVWDWKTRTGAAISISTQKDSVGDFPYVSECWLIRSRIVEVGQSLWQSLAERWGAVWWDFMRWRRLLRVNVVLPCSRRCHGSQWSPSYSIYPLISLVGPCVWLRVQSVAGPGSQSWQCHSADVRSRDCSKVLFALMHQMLDVLFCCNNKIMCGVCCPNSTCVCVFRGELPAIQ